MKRFFHRSVVLLLFLCISSGLFAQLPNIQSLFIIPSNPTTQDIVKVVAETVFPSGGCELTWSTNNILNGTIDVYAQHTLGMMTYICTSIDTITLGTLESGDYNLLYHLSCTPFPTGSDLDSIYFTVQTYTGWETKNPQLPFTLYPNPVHDIVTIQWTNNTSDAEIVVVDMQGREQARLASNLGQAEMDISHLAKGVYFIRLITEVGSVSQKLIRL
jgi:hypothetical protein